MSEALGETVVADSPFLLLTLGSLEPGDALADEASDDDGLHEVPDTRIAQEPAKHPVLDAE